MQVELATPTTTDPTQVLLAWVRQNFGLAFGAEHHEAFTSRVASFCRAERLTVEQLPARLSVNERLQRRFENVLSTPYTYFFREPEAFAYLTSEVLPLLRDEPEVRMWSAAAATGDEAYSMAIVARETYGDSGPAVCILATDLSEQHVATGERGEVQAGHLHDVEPGRRARWFTPSGVPDRVLVAPELRALCTFRRLNLTATPWPFVQQFHVILLRNVLYYFDDVTVHAVLQAATQQLMPGGTLVTSVTEPIDFVPAGLVRVASGIYRRVEVP